MFPCPPSRTYTLQEPGHGQGKSLKIPHTRNTTFFISSTPAGLLYQIHQTQEQFLSCYYHPHTELTSIICYVITILVLYYTLLHIYKYKYSYITISLPYMMHIVVVCNTIHSYTLCLLFVFYIICILFVYCVLRYSSVKKS